MSAAAAVAERRHSRRLRLPPEVDLEECRLVNASQGGMCLRTSRALAIGAVLHFVVEMDSPVEQTILLTGRVCWTAATGPCIAGIAFLDSSKGWFGPD
jgi:hypothetical protein